MLDMCRVPKSSISHFMMECYHAEFTMEKITQNFKQDYEEVLHIETNMTSVLTLQHNNENCAQFL